MASITQRDFFAENILQPIGNQADLLNGVDVTGFLSMKGFLYNYELMIVGRSVNGWRTEIHPSQLTSSTSRTAYAQAVLDSVNCSDRCPMLWVTDCWGVSELPYNSKRSAFWRSVKAVVNELGIANTDDSTWQSHLVWSNLLKVSPATGWNLGGTLFYALLDL